MARTVWCVFQRLEGESCPTLAAVCGSRDVAERLVADGEGEAGEWTISAWSVVETELPDIQEIDQMSDALDPWRAGTLSADAEVDDEPALPRPESE